MSRAVALCLLAAAACGGSRPQAIESPHEDSEDRQPLDRCLGDVAKPLAPAPIAAAWQQIVRGEKPAPLELRSFSSGICTPTWWTPVSPGPACGEPGTRHFYAMRDAGTIVVDFVAGTVALRPPGDEMFEIDGHTVVRRSIPPVTGAGATPLSEAGLEVVIESGPPSSPRVRRVPGFPEHIIDDDRAIVATPEGMSVYDLAAGKLVLPVRPRANTKGSVAATVAVADPVARNGARAIGGLVFDEQSEAFAITGAGKLITSVRGPAGAVAYPAVAPDGTMTLAAYRAPTLEVATITRAGATKRTTAFPATVGTIPPRVIAERDVIAVVIGTRVLIWRTGAEPITLDANNGRLTARFLAGGNVLVLAEIYGERDGVTAIDTRTGKTLVHIADRTPRFSADGQRVVMRDSTVATDQAVVVDASGAVTRGAVTKVRVGRYDIDAFAGVPDPATACSAASLSLLPPLLSYPGPYYLPADLVVD